MTLREERPFKIKYSVHGFLHVKCKPRISCCGSKV